MWIQRVYLTIVFSPHFIIWTVGFEHLSPYEAVWGAGGDRRAETESEHSLTNNLHFFC